MQAKYPCSPSNFCGFSKSEPPLKSLEVSHGEMEKGQGTRVASRSHRYCLKTTWSANPFCDHIFLIWRTCGFMDISQPLFLTHFAFHCEVLEKILTTYRTCDCCDNILGHSPEKPEPALSSKREMRSGWWRRQVVTFQSTVPEPVKNSPGGGGWGRRSALTTEGYFRLWCVWR